MKWVIILHFVFLPVCFITLNLIFIDSTDKIIYTHTTVDKGQLGGFKGKLSNFNYKRGENEAIIVEHTPTIETVFLYTMESLYCHSEKHRDHNLELRETV